MELVPAVKYVPAWGWTSQTLKGHLSRRPEESATPAAVLAWHLAEFTHAAKSLAPAQDTLVRRVRRRAIPDHHCHTPGRD